MKSNDLFIIRNLNPIIRVLNNARYSILCVNAVENIFTENIIKVTSSLELKLSFPTFISE